MKLLPKNKTDNWLKIDEETSFKIKYPTRGQSEIIQDMLYNQTTLDEATAAKAAIKLWQQYIKYTVADWKGVDDGNGNPVKCELVERGDGFEMEDSLWWELVAITPENIAEKQGQLMGIYNMITKHLEFNETDKKKLKSSV